MDKATYIAKLRECGNSYEDGKRIFEIVEFSDGTVIPIMKSQLETSFCFDDSYDYDDAAHMAYHVAKTELYFRNKNIEKSISNRYIHYVTDGIAYLGDYYYGKPHPESVVKRLHVVRNSSDIEGRDMFYRYLTDDEKQMLIDAYNRELVAFTKRINSYLKRYGTSKVKTWTYWGNE